MATLKKKKKKSKSNAMILCLSTIKKHVKMKQNAVLQTVNKYQIKIIATHFIQL